MGKLETPQSLKETRNSAKSSEIPLEALKETRNSSKSSEIPLKARNSFLLEGKRRMHKLCNFDINVSPPHFNLTSALEVEDKYKTEVEEKLR